MISRFDLPAFLRDLWLEAVAGRRELAGIGLLIGYLAAILSVFRAHPASSVTVAMLMIAGGLALAGLWLWLARGSTMMTPSPVAGTTDPPRKREGQSLASIRPTLLEAGIVAAVLLAIFYPTMLLHFDTGTDTSVGLGVDRVWMPVWADINRPLVGLGCYIALLIDPTGISGFFIVILVTRFLTALLILSLVRMLLPSAGRMVGLFAAILYIVNPAELGRFNLWAIWYTLAVFTFVAAIFCYLRSYLTGSRPLLIVAMALLLITFLQYEHGYPIAAALPFLLFLLPKRPHRVVWILAWLGLVAVLAIRMATYLTWFGRAYQMSLFNIWGDWPTSTAGYLAMYGRNLVTQVSPTFRFLDVAETTPAHLALGLAAALAVFAVLALLARSDSAAERPGRLALATGLGLLTATLGILLYVPLPITSRVPDYGTQPTLRYQFFAGPGQALFWSLLVATLASLVPAHRARGFVAAGLVALLVGLSTANGLAYQAKGGVLNPHYRWDTATRVLRQVAAALPETKRGEVIFVELPDGEHSPLGWGYTAFHWSCILFGVPMTQGRQTPAGVLEQRVFGYAGGLHMPTPACARTHHFRANLKGEVTFVGSRESEAPNAAATCTPCSMRQTPRRPGTPPPFIQER